MGSGTTRLVKIGCRETETQGFKEKTEGSGRSFYQSDVVETASVMRVYEDGTIAVKHERRFWRLKPETLKIENPIDESATKNDNLGWLFV